MAISIIHLISVLQLMNCYSTGNKVMLVENFTVSVIIPVKNSESTIVRCLKAVYSQTVAPLEVIVVDGHSVDKTVENALSFPIRLVYENYGTVGGARQLGLEAAKGDFVAFTDADCIPEKDWLENLVNDFGENFVGVGGSINNVGEGIWGTSIALVADTFLGSANSVQGRMFNEKRIVKSISGCNSMYRRSDLLNMGGFDITLSINEETELNKRLTKNGNLLYVPSAIILHDQNRSITDFAKRIYQFGYGRGKLRLWELQCVPPLILLLLIFSLIFTPWLFVGVISIYAILLLVMGILFTIKTNDVLYLLSIPIIYVIEHVSYSTGFIKGLIQGIV